VSEFVLRTISTGKPRRICMLCTRAFGVCVCVCVCLSEGVHLEGPFISREKKGAHDESLILPSLSGGMDEVRRVYRSLDEAAIVTVAPELPGAIDVIRQLTSRGIVVSLGNLACTPDDLRVLFNSSASVVFCGYCD